jgi:hypothetical protein
MMQFLLLLLGDLGTPNLCPRPIAECQTKKVRRKRFRSSPDRMSLLGSLFTSVTLNS